jgi:hypothetical protein
MNCEGEKSVPWKALPVRMRWLCIFYIFARGIPNNKDIVVEMLEAVGSIGFKVSFLRIFKENGF